MRLNVIRILKLNPSPHHASQRRPEDSFTIGIMIQAPTIRQSASGAGPWTEEPGPRWPGLSPAFGLAEKAAARVQDGASIASMKHKTAPTKRD